MSSLFLFLFLPFPVLHDLTDWLQCWCWTRKPNICHFLVAILPSPPIAVAIYLLQLVAIILRLLHISCPLPSSTATNHILTALFYNMLKLEKISKYEGLALIWQQLQHLLSAVLLKRDEKQNSMHSQFSSAANISTNLTNDVSFGLNAAVQRSEWLACLSCMYCFEHQLYDLINHMFLNRKLLIDIFKSNNLKSKETNLNVS